MPQKLYNGHKLKYYVSVSFWEDIKVYCVEFAIEFIRLASQLRIRIN